MSARTAASRRPSRAASPTLSTCTGRLPPVHWLPDPAFFGDGALERAKNALGIVPVVMTA